MAKALLGGVGRMDPHMAMTLRKLQQRVVDLETELVRLQAENETLHAALAPTRQDVVVLTSGEKSLDEQLLKEPVLA